MAFAGAGWTEQPVRCLAEPRIAGSERHDARFTAALVSPVPEKTVHVAVGEQWADHPALRRTAGALLAAANAPPSIRVRFLDRCLEPRLDQALNMAVDEPGRDRM